MLGIERMVFGGLLGLLAALAMAMPAQAAVVKGTCTVNGNAKMTDKTDTTLGVRLSGGHGLFSFKADLVCKGLEKGTPATVTFKVTSKGYYDSVWCGFGVAVSQWGQNNNNIVAGSFQKIGGNPSKNQAYYQAILTDLKYLVEIAGVFPSVGMFYWHNAPADNPGSKPLSSVKQPTIPKPFSDTKGGWDQSDKEYVYAGKLKLTFPLPLIGKPFMGINQATGNCTTSVDVRGAVSVDIF